MGKYKIPHTHSSYSFPTQPNTPLPPNTPDWPPSASSSSPSRHPTASPSPDRPPTTTLRPAPLLSIAQQILSPTATPSQSAAIPPQPPVQHCHLQPPSTNAYPHRSPYRRAAPTTAPSSQTLKP
ncbi:hypothetical protein RND81_11G134400 [Saponaria officinalis]|uniref:Uncharacterized protein n=1 Tax=Saponaria officinalis TaxID=3572 RepID=A0AAW1HKM9_SAPOF